MKISLNDITESDFYRLKIPQSYLKIRRIGEIIFVLILAPLILSVSIIVMILIKIESRGPILFIQERPGEGGRTFKLFKFRSMRSNFEEGEKYWIHDENKVTRFGKFIRKHSLDEIPQFLNILLGNMSLIGPRPEPVSHYRECIANIPFYNYRYIIKPGITGWGQVNYKHTLNIEDARKKTEYDCFYLFNLSPRLDLIIIFKTLKVIFRGRT
jgi:UDP-GalNAc:undecaprenyl-phosphate GalNAc-1-phosphate transferase